MANKLQKVFNKKDIVYRGSFRIKDKAAALSFKEAINAVFENGDITQIDGKAAVSLGIDIGSSVFPLENFEEVTEITIGPSVVTREIPIMVDGKRELLALNSYIIKDGSVVETPDDFVFDIKLIFNNIEESISLTFSSHLERALNVKEALVGIKQTQGLFKALFEDDVEHPDENWSYLDLMIKEYCDIFDALLSLEEMFNISFKTELIDLKDNDSFMDLIEASLTLREKMALRVNAKMTDIESTGVSLQSDLKIKENAQLTATFMGNMKYCIWGQTLELYCAMYLGNAIVKKIETQEDGENRIVYGDSEAAPMYMSYKGFVTEEEAKEELKSLMNHRDEYEHAVTAEQLFSEHHSLRRC